MVEPTIRENKKYGDKAHIKRKRGTKEEIHWAKKKTRRQGFKATQKPT